MHEWVSLIPSRVAPQEKFNPVPAKRDRIFIFQGGIKDEKTIVCFTCLPAGS